MNGSIIIICILSILLWFYFMKYSEHEIKYLPVMVKQKQVISQLRNENVKLKSKLKYLQTYKNDVSKTFQILDNELVMINDKLKQESLPIEQTQTQTQTQTPLFQTSFTPSILNSLLNSVNTDLTTEIQNTAPLTNPTDDIFNNIFNRFLTGQDMSTSLPTESIQTEPTETLRSSIQFSTNLLPLNNSYRQFLLNRNVTHPVENEIEQEQEDLNNKNI